MSVPRIVTVILNTNRRENTLACLASLARNAYPNHQVIVLDNASSDGSVAAIHEAFPDVETVSLSRNSGYAGNNNVGISAAMLQGADWVFVLNEDTVLAPDCLEHLATVGTSDDKIGIVGPMVYHFDEKDTIQSAGGVLTSSWKAMHLGQNEPDDHRFATPHQVDWISGCAIMVRHPVIEQVGMLDERFFYYWEEVDWCLRARQNGWHILQVPQAKLWHRGVQRDYRPNPSVTYYSTRNRFLLLKKHRAPLPVWIAAWSETMRTLASWSIKPRWKSQFEHRNAMVQGTVDFLRQRWGQRRA